MGRQRLVRRAAHFFWWGKDHCAPLRALATRAAIHAEMASDGHATARAPSETGAGKSPRAMKA